MSEIHSTELATEYIRSVFGKTLKLAMNITRGAGGLSISPLLSVRGFIRDNSPIFALFELFFLDPDYQRMYGSNLTKYLDYASTRMLQLFNEGCGSPYDVDMDGNTILHVSACLHFHCRN
jgi:hypothetical protein